MVRYQSSREFHNNDTRKIAFNRLERKMKYALGFGLLCIFAFLLSNGIIQIYNCDKMFQRYMDISIDSFMILLEITVATFFISTIRNFRSMIWQSTKVEVIKIFLSFFIIQTYLILLGILFSFMIRIILKSLHSQQFSVFSASSSQSYQVKSFFSFLIGEFIPIMLWTGFKTPHDYFQKYNDLSKTAFFLTFLNPYYQTSQNSRSSKSTKKTNQSNATQTQPTPV